MRREGREDVWEEEVRGEEKWRGQEELKEGGRDAGKGDAGRYLGRVGKEWMEDEYRSSYLHGAPLIHFRNYYSRASAPTWH